MASAAPRVSAAVRLGFTVLEAPDGNMPENGGKGNWGGDVTGMDAGEKQKPRKFFMDFAGLLGVAVGGISDHDPHNTNDFI